MTTPTVTEIRRNGNPVGERIELARYTVRVGERVLYGQRVNGVVSFLPSEPVVLVASSQLNEDRRCRSREALSAGTRPDAVRPKRQDGAGAASGPRDGRS